MVLYTIGHSTHPVGIFMGLLVQNQIAALVDVRSFPGSRRWPQFNQSELKASLGGTGILYEWCKELGGRRHSRFPDSPHKAWQLTAFRSYADYAETAVFAAGIESLCELATEKRTAMMCSEGLWWRCHRRIIADHLLVRGWNVQHILPRGKLTAHLLADFARIDGLRIIYDGNTK